MRWLFRWQHVAPGTQLTGERGTLEVLQQLQGFEAMAMPGSRSAGRTNRPHDPKVLDDLCLTGAVMGRAARIPRP
jgi:ATP-dependent Lhr-like helicase